MKCAVLAAGYATRLYPITENFPKPLLEVRGKTILDWLLDDIDKSGEIDGYIIISNHRYAEHFEKWAKNKKLSAPIEVIDDGSTENQNRLGAVADIDFAIKSLNVDDDMLVIAGDNVLDFSLRKFISYFKEKKTTCIMRYYEEETKKLQKCGVALIDENDLVISMEEKPSCPKSNWCVPPFYVYAREDIPMVGKGINEGCKTDAPGSFISWLCDRRRVHALAMPGKRYDIGNLESYEQVKKDYKGINENA